MSADNVAARMPPSTAPAPRARTHTMIVIAIAWLGTFLVLLVVGVIPRVSNHRALAAAAAGARSAVPGVQVLQPVPGSDASLVLAGTTQAIQDAVIYARTSGYLSKRYVDIGDQVRAGQLLAEIASPEVEQQLSQSRANLRQSERNLDLQRASLDLARLTMARYQAADAEKAVAIEPSIRACRSAPPSGRGRGRGELESTTPMSVIERLTSFQRVLAPFSGTVAAQRGRRA